MIAKRIRGEGKSVHRPRLRSQAGGGCRLSLSFHQGPGWGAFRPRVAAHRML